MYVLCKCCNLISYSLTYGRSFKLANPNNRGWNAPRSGLPQASPYTGEEGFLAHYEICAKACS